VSSPAPIVTSGSVVVKQGADVLFASASRITLSPGFRAEAGSLFRAWVPDLNAYMLIVIDGDNQTSAPQAFNALPLDVAVWRNGNPVVNLPVTFSVQQGGGLLYANPSAQGASQLVAISDADGTAQVYYRQPATGGVTSIISASAAGKTISFHSYSSGVSSGAGSFAEWAAAHGLNPNDPTVAGQSSSNDGLTNYQKYKLGLNPWQPASQVDSGNTLIQLNIHAPRATAP